MCLKFQETIKLHLLVVAIAMCKASLNLTRASYVFHLDPWWNPAVENQASDRAHRIGQKNTVFVNRILMHHTIEEKMMLLKTQKLELYEAILGKDQEVKQGTALTKSDFEFLLT